MRTLYFDMDGTFVDLYGIRNWKELIDSHNPSPYIEAAPLISMLIFTHWLRKAKAKGYRIGIISWLSRSGDEVYHAETKKAKAEWLNRYLPLIEFDEVHFIPYGTPKSSVVADAELGSAILFDDNADNLAEWKGYQSVEASEMLEWFMNNV